MLSEEKKMRKYLVLMLVIALALPALIVPGLAKTTAKKTKPGSVANPSDLFVNRAKPQQAQGNQVTPVASKAVGFAISPALRDLPDPKPERNTSITAPGGQDEGIEINPQNSEEVKHATDWTSSLSDPLLQTKLKGGTDMNSNVPAIAMPTPALTFEGLSSQNNLNATGGSTVMPPDTEGDVGPNHYVQGVNIVFNVFDKATGNPLLGANGRLYKQLFGPLGGICSTRNDGDPIIQYDQLADRWMISQFCTANDPFPHQMMAISTTPDPTGSYYLYDFMMPNVHFPDYPHYGVWPDGYYMTANVFNNTAATAFVGAGSYAFDRQRMLVGDSTASMIYIDESQIDPTLGGELPTDADGLMPPAPGTPNLICEFRNTFFGDPFDALRCFEFRPNYDNPNLTTFTQIPDIATAPFDGRNPGVSGSSPTGRSDVEEPSPATSSQYLDSLGGRLMYRLAYRNLGTASAPVNSYVTNWTVNVSGVTPSTAATYQAGIRWTELRRDPSTGAMSIRDQGTYVNGAISGATGENDWMGSIAQDNQGNLALGYSASSTSLLPTIKWAGRTGAPSGTLDQGEAVMFSSTGVQQATNNRWGDYSFMSVDPNDDCTFWYTQEYRLLANQGASGTPPFLWNTRIGNFKFPTCTTAPRGTISGQVTLNGNPVPNAMVYTSNGFFRVTDGSGNYTINNVAPDTYTVTAFKRGIGDAPTSVNGVTVTNGNTTIQNIALASAADVSLGTVTITEGAFSNGNGHVDPGETGQIAVTLNDPSGTPATGVTATLTVKEPTTGVNIAQPNARSLGTIPGNGSVSTGGQPFQFTLASTTPIGITVQFILRVDFSNGQSPAFLPISFTTGVVNATFANVPDTTLDTTPPPVPPGAISATTGTQTGRLSRSGVASGCGAQKVNPGLIAGDTTSRQYDAYVYNNPTNDLLCVTVTVNQTGTALYTAAYGNGGFVPSNPATNFLGDPGASASSMVYSFDVPPQSNFTIVVHDVTPPAGIGQSYNISISTIQYNLPPVRRRSDFDVDLKSDAAVFRPSEGNWYYRNSSTGIIQSQNWGLSTDIPVPGDYDGDGKTDFAVFRPSEGNWYIINSFDGSVTVKGWGVSTDKPVPGDYDGDGKTDLAVFRPNEGKWYLLLSWSNTVQSTAWGSSTDKPVPGDYDGDGKTDLAVFRPSEGNWYIKKSSGGQSIQGWGVSSDIVIPADYDGDRKTDIAIFRPSEGNWYILKSTGGVTVQGWGNSTDVPVPGDYDGDGKTDIAVFRPAEGNWYIINSSNSSLSLLNLGTTNDRPVPFDYIPNP
jgi:hypothetical protein